MNEYDKFNRTMDTILKVSPKAVRAAMDTDKKVREEQRKAKRASADRASTGKG